ncbi:hypothetical protein VP1G_11233 [Cytospora mali]|uniref:Uncharacterized protein n=1 Tax=Cytospora mali TaxID=578113 RepID=A0A194V8W3_CYTMA|nr:hypothetical protein VP1G_11233 [Valsa mali var. pyri (nom. inval.)]
MTRESLYEYVRSKDPHGAISKKLIGWHDEPTYEANARAWNGRGYECYFCHRLFNQQALYHCPNCNCGRDFTTLAATINHLESESCGFVRFGNVQRGIGDMISRGRLIGY